MAANAAMIRLTEQEELLVKQCGCGKLNLMNNTKKKGKKRQYEEVFFFCFFFFWFEKV
jgi:hypothetical protein